MNRKSLFVKRQALYRLSSSTPSQVMEGFHRTVGRIFTGAIAAACAIALASCS